METPIKTPVLILNGFLGSGKTTLFRNLLTQAKTKGVSVGAIVNDMSELDVDGELIGNTGIVEEGVATLETIHSCVLSSRRGIEKLDQALKRLLSEKGTELIIIETSGSCHPLPLVEYFKRHAQTRLIGVFACVDALMLTHDFECGEALIPSMQQNMAQGRRGTVNLLVEQILFSSHAILTKSDRVPEQAFSRIVTSVQSINPYVPALSVQFGRLALDTILDLPEYDYYKVARLIAELKPVLAAEGDRPYNLATRVIQDDRPFHPQRLWEVCHQHLDKGIYRSKGFFWLATRDKFSLLWSQSAGGIALEIHGSWRAGIVEDENHGISEMEIELLKEQLSKEHGRFGDRRCDLTVIGDATKVGSFAEALESCFLTEKEIELWRSGHIFDDPWPTRIVTMS